MLFSFRCDCYKRVIGKLHHRVLQIERLWRGSCVGTKKHPKRVCVIHFCFARFGWQSFSPFVSHVPCSCNSQPGSNYASSQYLCESNTAIIARYSSDDCSGERLKDESTASVVLNCNVGSDSNPISSGITDCTGGQIETMRSVRLRLSTVFRLDWSFSQLQCRGDRIPCDWRHHCWRTSRLWNSVLFLSRTPDGKGKPSRLTTSGFLLLCL